jgi:hypothetical protein
MQHHRKLLFRGETTAKSHLIIACAFHRLYLQTTKPLTHSNGIYHDSLPTRG